jgi:Tfp pilus assembly PilM family ATPase
MYVDAGWGSVKVVLGRGSNLVFARIVQVGGRHIDQFCAEAWGTTPSEAQSRRIREEARVIMKPTAPSIDMSEEKGSAMLRAGIAKARVEDSNNAEAAATATLVNRRKVSSASLGQSLAEMPCIDGHSEIYETIGDELSLCSRYAAAAIQGSTIHRLVFLGGECRSRSLASHLAQAVGVKASVGDPLSRFLAATPEGAGDIDSGCEHPEWAVACGLCAAPMEL